MNGMMHEPPHKIRNTKSSYYCELKILVIRKYKKTNQGRKTYPNQTKIVRKMFFQILLHITLPTFAITTIIKIIPKNATWAGKCPAILKIFLLFIINPSRATINIKLPTKAKEKYFVKSNGVT